MPVEQCIGFYRSLTREAPWPKGFMAKWWVNEVFKNRIYQNRTEYQDLIDIRRFFWSLRKLLCSCSHLRVGLVRWGLAGEGIGRARGSSCQDARAQCSC